MRKKNKQGNKLYLIEAFVRKSWRFVPNTLFYNRSRTENVLRAFGSYGYEQLRLVELFPATRRSARKRYYVVTWAAPSNKLPQTHLGVFDSFGAAARVARKELGEEVATYVCKNVK